MADGHNKQRDAETPGFDSAFARTMIVSAIGEGILNGGSDGRKPKMSSDPEDCVLNLDVSKGGPQLTVVTVGSQSIPECGRCKLILAGRLWVNGGLSEEFERLPVRVGEIFVLQMRICGTDPD